MPSREAMITPVGEPIELRRQVTAGVTFGNDETAIGGHPAVAPITFHLIGKVRVKSEAPPRQGIEREAHAPVERQEATCLAGCRGGHPGPFHHDYLDPAASKKVGSTGADHATTADYDAHSTEKSGPLPRWDSRFRRNTK